MDEDCIICFHELRPGGFDEAFGLRDWLSLFHLHSLLTCDASTE